MLHSGQEGIHQDQPGCRHWVRGHGCNWYVNSEAGIMHHSKILTATLGYVVKLSESDTVLNGAHLELLGRVFQDYQSRELTASGEIQYIFRSTTSWWAAYKYRGGPGTRIPEATSADVKETSAREERANAHIRIGEIARSLNHSQVHQETSDIPDKLFFCLNSSVIVAMLPR